MLQIYHYLSEKVDSVLYVNLSSSSLDRILSYFSKLTCIMLQTCTYSLGPVYHMNGSLPGGGGKRKQNYFQHKFRLHIINQFHLGPDLLMHSAPYILHTSLWRSHEKRKLPFVKTVARIERITYTMRLRT